MKNKIINVLMWVPIIGIFIGIMETIKGVYCIFKNHDYGENWFLRINPIISLLNGIYLGFTSIFIISLLIL